MQLDEVENSTWESLFFIVYLKNQMVLFYFKITTNNTPNLRQNGELLGRKRGKF